jgi:hypothetical protein
VKSLVVGLIVASLSLVATSAVTAHKVDRVTIRSICHYEERYYVWTAGERWRVLGRVKPRHRGDKVVLQRSKGGRNWKAWKDTRTNSRGRYLFRGIAPRRNGFYANLRVAYPRQNGHGRKTSHSIYVDTNPLTNCG